MSTMTMIDNRAALRTIAATLPDTPETVIARHALQRGLCRAYVSGALDHLTALVIDNDAAPGEPACFGDDADALWGILRWLPGWFAANMSETLSGQIGAYITRDWNVPVSYYGDPHFTLQRPAPLLSNSAVRLLTVADLPLLDAAPVELRGASFGSPRGLLEDGIAAAAVVDGSVVATAHTSAITDGYADIAVTTLPGFRERGYATAAAALVARAIQQVGRIPVWSCGETNHASCAIARKLGFAPVLRRVYVIVESRR